MIVDSSALAEQVVADVLMSAFDSAGQRCSALRVLCLQEDIAERTLGMLKGALAELAVGNPDRLWIDIGPVITAEARDTLNGHIEAMRRKGHAVEARPLPDACAHGTFVAPTIIEIDRFSDLEREVFGPVLHVLRYRRDGLDALLGDINASGYGLTFGLHTRLDETIAHVTRTVEAGNIYVNRNLIGAVVGVQPFGGNGLSGTGPKAGGPLYLRRLCTSEIDLSGHETGSTPSANQPGDLAELLRWAEAADDADAANAARAVASRPGMGHEVDLPGPVGERNTYGLRPRGTLLAVVQSRGGLWAAVAAALATGNSLAVHAPESVASRLQALPPALGRRMAAAEADHGPYQGVLFEGDGDGLRDLAMAVAAWPGGVVPVHSVTPGGLASGREAFPLDWLQEEVVVSVNTAAAGGNASLMTIG